MMKKLVYFCAIAALAFQSCSVMKDVKKANRTADYTISLTSVEIPANAKEQFGETITVDKSNSDTSRYVYEDKYMKISWYVGRDMFYFKLCNKTKHALKIIWDDAALVMPDSSISRLMHNGIKYSQKNETQVATTVPSGAKLTDVLVPTENVDYSNQIGWYVSPILKHSLTTDYETEKAMSMKGKALKVLLPIKIEEVQNEYTFVFTIDDVTIENQMTTEKERDDEASTALNVFLGVVLGSIIVVLCAM